jgi:uncharacterized integral membrane protein (TIGR00698 family)
MNQPTENDIENPVAARKGLSEDWASGIAGVLVLVLALAFTYTSRPEKLSWSSKLEPPPVAEQESSTGVAKTSNKPVKPKWETSLKSYIGKIGSWTVNPMDSFYDAKAKASRWQGILGAFFATGLVCALGILLQRQLISKFLLAFPLLFLLAVFANVLATQTVVEKYNFEYPLWALLIGMIICNTIGTPEWLKPAVRGELYIKIGLVLLGAEVLFGRLLSLGIQGVCISWVVTPVVLIGTYIFGQRVLKMESKSLNIVISADMSVCGVSAAIATAAACKAKKEELSLAIGLSLAFTAIMMVLMPLFITWIQLDPRIGGAWIGGTIDSTGAVAAAGEVLGPIASETAVTIKMIQNILIGVVAFGVAIYWTRYVETGKSETGQIGIGEIWKRFPKFVLGFVIASILCSVIYASSLLGELWVDTTTGGITKQLRIWIFCVAFVCLGLDTNIAEMLPYFRTGKPMILYLCGQALNLLLTFLMAYLMFGILFK